MTLTALVNKQIVLKGSIERLIENGKRTATAKRSQGFYEGLIQDLKTNWEEFVARDREINEALLGDAADKTCENIKVEQINELQVKYLEYMGTLHDGLRSIITPNNSAQARADNTTGPQYETPLPRISLPQFNGDYDTWQSFHDLFISLVHNNTTLLPVHKLHYLKGCLVGEAEQLLRHTPITNQDYPTAWNKLKERYQNKRILVNHQLKRLLNQPKITQETVTGIKSLLDTSEECLQQLKALNVDTSSWDVLLIHLLIQKLPFVTLKRWEEEQGAETALPKYSDFSKFLHTRLKILESISDKLVSKPQQIHTIPKKEITQAYHIAKNNNCAACKEQHFIGKCPKYKQLDVKNRIKLITSGNCCYNCLASNHTVAKCFSKNRCFKCQRKHHTSLHEEEHEHNNRKSKSPHEQQELNENQGVSIPYQTTPSSDNSVHTTHNFIAMENQHTLLSTALVVVINFQGQQQQLRCLIDPGSQSSFITSAAFKKLRLPSSPTSMIVTGLGNSKSTAADNFVRLKLGAYWGTSSVVEDDFFIISKIAETLPTTVIRPQKWLHLQGLRLADPTFCKPGSIDLLLGAKGYAQILRSGVRRGPTSAPIGINTTFGWIVLGPTHHTYTNTVQAFMITNEKLDEQLKRFWEIEDMPTKPCLSEEDAQCELFFQETHTRLPDGRYQVTLPFADNKGPSLGQSRQQASQRFKHLQRKFQNNPQFEADYRNCLHEYIDLKHMEEVDPPKPDEPHYYIPHHAVIKESTTTKLRVVFDASARSSNGKSLNSELLAGPTLQPKLFATLLNWRKYRLALNADIEKMYRMIGMHPDHRTFQRIIWQDPTTMELKDYQLNTVTFGTSSAPYLAVRTLQQLAEDEKQNHPLAARATFNHFYVDDLLTGADTIEEATSLRDDFINMLKKGGFTLRKWASNSSHMLEDIPLEHRELKNSLMFTNDESIKTLGIQWHPGTDHFSWKLNIQFNARLTTKRILLSEVASLYDPLGWLAPVVVTAKILMQTLWIQGCSWDEPVPDTIQEKWDTFKHDLHNINELRIPRWVNYSPKYSLQIHGFCDASSQAYAAAIYLRVQDTDNMTTIHLLTSKTKVAPVKLTTIPRLELNGALLLARLIKETKKDMQLENVPVVAWTDSTITLQWIKQHPSRWKCYVANRVTEIQEIIRYNNWRHVPTRDNPADMASRGIPMTKLLNDTLWWNGPAWLRLEASQWPTQRHIVEETQLEAKTTPLVSFFSTIDDTLLNHYSSFARITRIIALLKRFTYNCSHKQSKVIGSLTSAELRQAEVTIFKIVQQNAFGEEYHNLLHDKPILKKSKLLTLTPFLHNDGLIRVGGRLCNAAIPFSRKHPIILPRDHHVTATLIDKIHMETLHGGTSLVLNTLRNQFWILGARRVITSRLHRCIVCTRYRNATVQQLMGNLPISRVNISKPFTEVGVDYSYKGYICIFVCMATKAIHIEAVSDLTSQAFIATLKRFIARRGLSRNIYSDCGTNFVGAAAVLDKDIKRAIKEAEPDVARYLTSSGISWHFNPPSAPNFGGLWEAGVKSIKYHLRRVIASTPLTFEEYATIFSQIEACLNSRPLCYVQSNSDDPLVLTPGHFLIGQPMNAMAETENSSCSLGKRWKHCQQIMKSFWQKWSQDYLNNLQQRPKWKTKHEGFKIGDVIIIKQNNTPPTYWPLGRINKVFPGKDGLIRVVEIKSENSTLLRPISKIIPLPVDNC